MTVTRTDPAAAALADTVTLPPHSAGDLILLWAYRAGLAWPLPSLPNGWTNLISGGSGFNCARLAYKFATSGSETCGVWSGASAVLAVVCHTDGRWKAPLASQTGNPFGSNTITYPDLAARPGTTKLLRFAGHRTATNMLANTPQGWTAAGGLATRVRVLDATAASIAANLVGYDTQAVNTIASYRTTTVSLADVNAPADGTPIKAVWDKIPPVATVLTLSGLNFNLYNDQPTKFQGLFAQAPYVMKKITYPANLGPNSIPDGVKALDKALLASSGPVIVLAQSQGAQVCTAWMTQYAADSTRAALASRIIFLLTGNPLRSTGNGGALGAVQVNGVIGYPTPTDTPWPIIDVARRWDGWADQPDDTDNAVAMKNAKLGKSTRHLGYDVVDLYDPTHTVWTVGNTTYVLTHEVVPPLLDGVDLSDEDNGPAIIAATRQAVEVAYDRSAYETPPAVPAEPNFYWSAVLTRLGITPPEES